MDIVFKNDYFFKNKSQSEKMDIAQNIKTHPEYITMNKDLPNAKHIYLCMSKVLNNQKMFTKCTPLEEKYLWEDEELNNFKIELEAIDRLYYILPRNIDSSHKFYLIVRMDYKERKVYVKLMGNNENNFLGYCGMIFISDDINLFLKNIQLNQHQANSIYESLAEDGIQFEEKEFILNDSDDSDDSELYSRDSSNSDFSDLYDSD